MFTKSGSILKSLPGPVLVTGHTGFKGTWLLLLLAELGIETAGFALAPEENALYNRVKPQLELNEKYADIRDRDSLAKFLNEIKPSYIFHLAAQPLVLESFEKPIETFDINVMGTAYLLDSARSQASVKGVSVITTDKVYQNLGLRKRFSEIDPLAGSEPYGASKVGTEAVVDAWQQISKQSHGPLISSLRAGNVIGGGDFAKNRLIPDLVRGAISGNPTEIRSPGSTRPWQHVLDPLLGYLAAAEFMLTTYDQDSFNFGPSEPSLQVADVVKISTETWPLIRSYLHDSSQSGLESEFLDLDSARATQCLKWSPRINQDGAIRMTIQWWKDLNERQTNAFDLCKENLEFFLVD